MKQLPPGLLIWLSDFLLTHLPLIQIRFLFHEKQTMELYAALMVLFNDPSEMDIQRFSQILRSYRCATLN